MISSTAVAELQEVFQSKETQEVIASARTHPKREMSKRLLLFVSITERILKEAGEEGRSR